MRIDNLPKLRRNRKDGKCQSGTPMSNETVGPDFILFIFFKVPHMTHAYYERSKLNKTPNKKVMLRSVSC